MSDNPVPDLRIQKVSTRAMLRAFISFPCEIYRDDPNWIPPLRFEQIHRFTDRNPLFQHARWQAWLAWKGNRVVGRISAQVDDLYLETQGDDTGFFGLIEAEDDPAVFSLLLSTAEDWLREQGMKRVRGPFNLSINEECGLLIDGLDTPPFVMMGHAREYYGSRIEDAGYGKAKDLLVYEIHPAFENPKVMEKLLRSIREDIRVRPIQRKQLKHELDVLRDIFNDSWSSNWGFTPMTEEEFADIGELLAMLIDDDFIQIAEVDGTPAAMIVAIPDINDVIRDLNGRLFPFGWLKILWRLKVRFPDRARVMLMGVRKRYQHSRLGPALAFLVIDAVRQGLVRRNVEKVEMGWVLEDNDGMNGIIEKIGGHAYKRYRIFEKPLPVSG